jgi:hypothetical protein
MVLQLFSMLSIYIVLFLSIELCVLLIENWTKLLQ